MEDGSLGWKEWHVRNKCEVKFVWTPSHEGIKGNDEADTQAKLAAKGNSSPKSKLPAMLRKGPLLTSISATRQLLKKELKTKWKEEWNTSPRYVYAHKIDPKLPSNDFLDIISQLRRNQASLLMQFRTRHAPLNAVLHRIKRADSPNCPHCEQGTKESIFHYLLICPHHSPHRRILQMELGRDAFSIPFLLGTRTGIPHFL